MFKNRTILLLVAAIVVIGAAATGIYFGVTTMQPGAPAVVEEDVAIQVPQAAAVEPAAVPVAGAISPAHRPNMSEAELKHTINEAADHHWDADAAALLHKLNDGYLRRVHLPW